MIQVTSHSQTFVFCPYCRRHVLTKLELFEMHGSFTRAEKQGSLISGTPCTRRRRGRGRLGEKREPSPGGPCCLRPECRAGEASGPSPAGVQTPGTGHPAGGRGTDHIGILTPAWHLTHTRLAAQFHVLPDSCYGHRHLEKHRVWQIPSISLSFHGQSGCSISR